METSFHQDLYDASKFVRQAMAAAKLPLDYSIDSVKHLDYVLGDAFVNGKLKHPESTFAQQRGEIMTGMAAYIAELVISQTKNSVLEIDPSDESWYINFTVVAANGWRICPGQRVMKRASLGAEAALHPYVLEAIKHFNAKREDLPTGGTYTQVVYVDDDSSRSDKKQWWKVW